MRKKTIKKRIEARLPLKRDVKLTFLEHFNELKRRLGYIAASVVGFSVATYFVQMHIVDLLLRPAEGQQIIYTTPGGGLNFLLQVCLYTGIILSLPVIIYQILKYLEPLLGEPNLKFALKGSIISGVLALAGILFGYFVGLPATLHFLFHQFTTEQIHALIAVQSYMSFVTLYMFGAALLFQVPLVLIFINRIKRLSPRTLFKFERWMILCSFVLAVLMNPTPNVVDQLMLAGPMVLMYQLGIAIIWFVNRGKRWSPKVKQLHAQDADIRADRQARLNDARMIWDQANTVADHPVTAATTQLTRQPGPTPRHAPPTILETVPGTPRYVDNFTKPKRRPVPPAPTDNTDASV